MKSVLVTGAHGFIGQNLTKACAKQGFNIYGVGHGQSVPWLTQWWEGDITSEGLSRLPIKPDIIFHCAGTGSVAASLEQPDREFERSVNSTKAVLEFIKNRNPECKLAFPSSGAVYGSQEGAISETTPLKPVSPYGEHKKQAEDLISFYSKEYGIKASIIRLFSVYGPGLKKQLLFDACKKILNHTPTFFGTGQESRDWIHIDDVVDLFLKSVENKSSLLIINGGTGLATATEDVLMEVFEALGKKEKPVFTGHSRPGDPVSYKANIALAENLGWKPRVFWKEGVRQYCDWFKSEYLCQHP